MTNMLLVNGYSIVYAFDIYIEETRLKKIFKVILEKKNIPMYNSKSVLHKQILQVLLAYSLCFMYNRQCWSLTAMMWKVADTPGRFAMARVWEISIEKVYFKIGEKEGK